MIRSLIVDAWIAIGVVWFAGGLRGKRTVRREKPSQRVAHLTGTILAAYLIIRPTGFPLLDGRAFPESAIGDGSGFALALAGIAFAIWARLLLGTNWSGTVTVKEGHELMRRGPYALVRHPIYTGALAGMLGTAVVWGEPRCFLAVALATFTFGRKLKVEENFLLEVFGDQYRQYQRAVSALIPGL